MNSGTTDEGYTHEQWSRAYSEISKLPLSTIPKGDLWAATKARALEIAAIDAKFEFRNKAMKGDRQAMHDLTRMVIAEVDTGDYVALYRALHFAFHQDTLPVHAKCPHCGAQPRVVYGPDVRFVTPESVPPYPCSYRAECSQGCENPTYTRESQSAALESWDYNLAQDKPYGNLHRIEQPSSAASA